MSIFFCVDVNAADNLKTEATIDDNTKSDKCPLTVTVQDNLKGDKDMDFSDLDCIYYQTDDKGEYLLDANGDKIPRKEDDEINFSCLQQFLDKYTNDEFKEAANEKIAEGFANNKYCPVYCVEENEFSFPGYAPVTNSGAHFTWTVGKINDKNILNGLTVKLHGTKVCRTQVDLNAWIEDYKNVMKEIEKLIDIKNPTGSRKCDCVDAKTISSEGAEGVSCSLNPNVSTLYYKISSSDFDIFETYSSLAELGGDDRTAELASDILLAASGVIPDENDAEDFIAGLKDDTDNVGDSDRYYITSTVTDVTETESGIIMLYPKVNYDALSENTITTADGISINYDMTNAENYDNLNEALKEHAASQGSTIITIRVDVHELNCCGWFKTQGQSGANKWATSSNDFYLIENGVPVTGTRGYKVTETRFGCGTGPGGTSLIGITSTCGETPCCGTCTTTQNYDRYCSKTGIFTEIACVNNGGNWITKLETTYKCSKDASEYKYHEEYYLKCGIEGTGDNQQIAASGAKSACSCSSVPSCPSGYSYSPRTGKCYYAKIQQIYTKLNQLLGLAKDLRACQDTIQNYDYYLETEMDVEYNKTSDSIKNFYLPNADATTTTKLNKVTENNRYDDDEDKLGEYSSEIIKPSEKSNVGGSINFFGTTYYFGKNGIPFVNCSLAGATKTCFATYNTSLSNYWYDWYGKTYVAMYEYRLDGDFYRWVKLPSGESISTMPTGDYLKYGRYIDIGYANYPVHYATSGGEYEGLNIKITNIGYKNYLYNTYQTAIRDYNGNLTDKDLVSTEEQNQLLHDCYYEVEEGSPYCPTTGCDSDDYELGSVRIIYRPISLENPFPAMDGSGRNTGSNWCILNDDTQDCSNQNNNVEKYILNNRNTEGSNIYYEKEPMYQITLTSNLIKQIRNYNSNTNYDDYNLYCSGLDGEEGTECRSHFVVGGMEETNLPSLRDYISGCGTSNDWYACDKLDDYER